MKHLYLGAIWSFCFIVFSLVCAVMGIVPVIHICFAGLQALVFAIFIVLIVYRKGKNM